MTSTTHVGHGIDPFEDPKPQTVTAPTELDWAKFRSGNPRYDSFAITVNEGGVAQVLPEDPNRSFFYITSDTARVYMGTKSQLVNGYGFPIAVVPSNGAKFTTNKEVSVALKSNGQGSGAAATVYVWVEYAN